MAEPTLSVTLGEIRREVSRFLSFGREYDALTITQQEDVDSIIRRGLRQFYYPPPSVAGMHHRWTFLQPTHRITTVEDQGVYALPDDFGAMVSTKLTYAGHEVVGGPQVVSDHALREVVESSPVASGRPLYATVRPRMSGDQLVSPTRYDLVMYPVPEREYLLDVVYSVVLDAVSQGVDIPAGASVHSETILASCLAIAEEYVVDPIAKYRELFRERLVSSIASDRTTRGGWRIGNMGRGRDERSSPVPRLVVRYDGHPQ